MRGHALHAAALTDRHVSTCAHAHTNTASRTLSNFQQGPYSQPEGRVSRGHRAHLTGPSQACGDCVRGSHPPCNTRPGPRRNGTCQRDSPSSSAGSTSARRSWLERGVRTSAGASSRSLSLAVLFPRLEWTPSPVDQPRPLPPGQVSPECCPLAKQGCPPPSLSQPPRHGRVSWRVGGHTVMALGQSLDKGCHPSVSGPGLAAV